MSRILFDTGADLTAIDPRFAMDKWAEKTSNRKTIKVSTIHEDTGIGLEYHLDLRIADTVKSVRFLGVNGLGKKYPAHQLKLDPKIKYRVGIKKDEFYQGSGVINRGGFGGVGLEGLKPPPTLEVSWD